MPPSRQPPEPRPAMPTSTEDADALFGLPPPPPPPPPPAAAATAISGGSFGDLAVASADNRREQRVKVSWPGRLQLPNGSVINLKVRDISEGGVGLLTEHHTPAYTVMNFAMGVPPMAEGGKITPVSGTL